MKVNANELPQWAEKFLRMVCPEPLLEEIEGDLIQRYQSDLKVYGTRKAKQRLAWNVMRYLRAGIVMRNTFSTESIQLYMIGNYFKMAIRHILQRRAFSFINVAGLAVSLASAFFILHYVSFELSFDEFHENKEEIYRVAYERYEHDELKNTSAKTFLGLRQWIKQYFPEVKACTHFVKIPANSGFLIMYAGKIYNEEGGHIRADSLFFKVFPSLLLRGDPDRVLKDEHSLVLSESVARKIFGNEDPLGKIIVSSDHNKEFVVTGILKDAPDNTHLKASFITPSPYQWDDPKIYWDGLFRLTYLTLPPATDPRVFQARLNTAFKTLAAAHPETEGVVLKLQRITDIHLQSNLQDELDENGNETLVYILSAIAMIILVMAWTNYINLQTAQLFETAKDIGVRRIMGSGKWHLSAQFLTEYFCINIAAIVLAILGIVTLFPHISFLTGISLHQLYFPEEQVWIVALALFMAGSVFVGIYPTFIFTRFNPVAVIKGKFLRSNTGSRFRKALVVFQFTASVALIAFVLVVSRQLSFMQTTNKKVDLDHVVSIKNPTAYSQQEEKDSGEGGFRNFSLLEQKLLQNPAVKMVSSSSAVPGMEIGFTYVDFVKRSKHDPYDPTRYKLLFIDYNFVALYGLHLRAGRNYSPDNAADKNWETLIINESAVRALGFRSPQEAVGASIDVMVVDDWATYTVVGVVADYHHEALKKAVLPTIYFPNHNKGQQVYYSVKIASGSNTHEALEYIERSWRMLFPEKPFEYFFVDEFYDRQFKSEVQFMHLFSWFSGVAICIACLGILGMTMFEMNTRIKEISIRKVLGASVAGLIKFLCKDHLRLVMTSSVISVPLVYWIASGWLSRYPVRVDVSWMFFLAPVCMVIVLVLLVTGLHTVKASKVNPVDHLKSE